MKADSEVSKTPKQRVRKRRRKPHNARVLRYNGVSEIVEAVGAEPRRLPTPDGDVTMTRKERLFQMMIERALREEVRDLTHMLRLMVRHPDISVGREEIQYFISRRLWNVCGGGDR